MGEDKESKSKDGKQYKIAKEGLEATSPAPKESKPKNPPPSEE